MQRILASQLDIFGEQSFSPQFLPRCKNSARGSINCGRQSVLDQTWGMFFVSWGQSLNLSSVGIFLMYLSLDAEAAL